MTTENDLGLRVDNYVQKLFNPSNPVLEETLQELERAGLPTINVSPNEGKLLHMLARLNRVQTILEIGTLAGYSTIWLGMALPSYGKMVSLEIDPKHAEVARKNIARAGLTDKIEVRLGPALESLAQLVEENAGSFDLVFIDADKDNYPHYLDFALKLTKPGSLILADNVIRNGAVLDENHPSPIVQGVQRYNQAVAANPGLTSILLPLIRENMDGLLISIVN